MTTQAQLDRVMALAQAKRLRNLPRRERRDHERFIELCSLLYWTPGLVARVCGYAPSISAAWIAGSCFVPSHVLEWLEKRYAGKMDPPPPRPRKPVRQRVMVAFALAWVFVWPSLQIQACFLPGAEEAHLCPEGYALTKASVPGANVRVCAKFV